MSVSGMSSGYKRYLGGFELNSTGRFWIWFAAIITGITGLHLYLNVDWAVMVNDTLPEKERRFNVAYIPVT